MAHDPVNQGDDYEEGVEEIEGIFRIVDKSKAHYLDQHLHKEEKSEEFVEILQN